MPPSGRHEKNEGLFKSELFVCAEQDLSDFWNPSYMWLSLRYRFFISTARRNLLIVFDWYYSLIRILEKKESIFIGNRCLPLVDMKKNEGLFKFELFACAERDITGFWNMSYLWLSLRYRSFISTAKRDLLIDMIDINPWLEFLKDEKASLQLIDASLLLEKRENIFIVNRCLPLVDMKKMKVYSNLNYLCVLSEI